MDNTGSRTLKRQIVMSKPASETLSKMISFLRFPMIVGIVLIHAQNQGLYEAGGGGF
jgi:hypothetical protein